MKSRLSLFIFLLLLVLVACYSFGRNTFQANELPISVVMVQADAAPALNVQFTKTIQPFLQKFCIRCHDSDNPEAQFDVSVYKSLATVVKDGPRLDHMLQRLKTEEMPPKKAKVQPSAAERRDVVAWFQTLRDLEIKRNAGDPGLVLARRLSNAEYNYTIRDLTGADIRPTREFPVDPANTAGFDNSGESLVMSPALLHKYLKAAHEVASYLFLKPNGFAFAPHPMVVETDRDKHCVMQIIDFYHRQDIDYADYFQAAWRFQHRADLGKSNAKLAEIATASKVSPKYLTTIWETLAGKKEEVGPMVKLQKMWNALPAAENSELRQGCEQMRNYVVQTRKKVEVRFFNISAGKVGAGTTHDDSQKCAICDPSHEIRSVPAAGRGRIPASTL